MLFSSANRPSSSFPRVAHTLTSVPSAALILYACHVPHDKRQEIRGHPGRAFECHRLAPRRCGLHPSDRHVRYGFQFRGDDERHLEGSLDRRFIPAGQCPPCIRRLKLRRREVPLRTVSRRVAAAIEAAQLVIQDAGEIEMQGGRARRERLREAQREAFPGIVIFDLARGKALPSPARPRSRKRCGAQPRSM